MALKVDSRIPHGNARDVVIKADGDLTEVSFAADPHGGPECLWFCFRLWESEQESSQPGKLRLVLKYFDTMFGAGSPSVFRPVFKVAEQGWMRLQAPKTEERPDGQIDLVWELPYPAPEVLVAFCYPYGPSETKSLIDRSKGYWKSEPIGLSQGGRHLTRLRNDHNKGGSRRSGVYLLARQHAGETPGSWVLDGFLQHLSVVKKNPLLVRAIPLADVDGVRYGDCGKDVFPCDMNRAWGELAMRHEVSSYQSDMQRWKDRCRPLFAVDFHACGACETDGCYVELPSKERFPEQHKAAGKWANVIRDALTTEYAADDFARVSSSPSRWETPGFVDYCCGAMDIPALTFKTPYVAVGKQLLSPKRYKEIGRRLGDVMIRRA